ncbi:hypothetical protein J4H86_01130 [Spiractinospora alimapuensis]|uniref:hypothetical protein n=1 Tax=Spiractinospora alimapuensis TaxID=2820884 RepID=UPI001F41E435|nr:hypothetical protein [Spiractinospora alimapuensis]QVQ52493.1 hypothetical protein J4H86_01130 [Spiractinospora alimapuensis]
MSVVEMFGTVTLVALTAAVLVFVATLTRDPRPGVNLAERDTDDDVPEVTEWESHASPQR